jgi:hypothetical protein
MFILKNCLLESLESAGQPGKLGRPREELRLEAELFLPPQEPKFFRLIFFCALMRSAHFMEGKLLCSKSTKI